MVWQEGANTTRAEAPYMRSMLILMLAKLLNIACRVRLTASSSTRRFDRGAKSLVVLHFRCIGASNGQSCSPHVRLSVPGWKCCYNVRLATGFADI